MSAGATRGRLRQVIPWLWLAISLLWAVVIIVTDELGWPLALWIATTVGPLTYLSKTEAAQGPGPGRERKPQMTTSAWRRRRIHT